MERDFHSDVQDTSEIPALKHFFSMVPVLKLVGTPHFIGPDILYVVDSDVQLVCKYLRAYKQRAESTGIDKLAVENPVTRKVEVLVKFSLDSDLDEDKCHALLKEYMPKHVVPTKITQQLFIRLVR